MCVCVCVYDACVTVMPACSACVCMTCVCMGSAERRGRGAFASEQSEVPCRDDLRGDSARAQLNKGLADSPCSI